MSQLNANLLNDTELILNIKLSKLKKKQVFGEKAIIESSLKISSASSSELVEMSEQNWNRFAID